MSDPRVPTDLKCPKCSTPVPETSRYCSTCGAAVTDPGASGPGDRLSDSGAMLGPALSGRLLVIVFERKPTGIARVITGWDMDTAERRYYQRHRRR